ncbi:spore germination protein [Thermosyntropha lipolytica DSM 11003]|uniref:Spore germination protein n=1 Tax=Thermosyntropha lipolytica DSM 11003 TaxID=1123382 RepID=A0A1M5NMI7_9FIRM|nr:spore germination protein [Thermosyntropha lipolytica]SHG90153.1 spore germination protein [Thermosyntropha lipolytica DSM 11003]
MFPFTRKRKIQTEAIKADMGADDVKLPSRLEEKIDLLKPCLAKNDDIVGRPFYLKGDPGLKAYVVHLEGIVDNISLQQDILRSLMFYARGEDCKEKGLEYIVDHIYRNCLTVTQIQKIGNFSEVIRAVFDGFVVLFFDGISAALSIDIRKVDRRNVEEPVLERALRGSKEGFVENIVVNTALIRRRLKDPNLVVKKFTVGKRTRTDVSLLYVEDIADPEIVRNVSEKLDNIYMDGILGTSYLEQLIEDHHYTPFPQFKTTERPDKAVMELLEGKIIVLADGSPDALIIPSLFVSFLQASEDYVERPIISFYHRFYRYLAFFLAVSLPALYIALLSFNPELVPVQLLISLAQGRDKVPFPVVLEVIIQEIIIQLVIETGLRLPTPMGQTVGVVAGIVLGQAAIAAGLASPAIIIIVAITTISTFAIPNSTMVLASRLVRVFMILMAAAFGMFGFSIGWFLLLVHLISLESMGVPYMAPYAPMRYPDFKDAVYRTFISQMLKRPVSIPVQDKVRKRREDG